MKAKMKLKIFIDFCMTFSLLMLMAYQVTGEELHEWIGTGMAALFLIHNCLNLKWYGSLFKGRYHLPRIFRTIVNSSTLTAMLVQAYRGIVMSRYVFSALPIEGGMAAARKLHLAGAYWAFVLMSVHLGLHWSMVTGTFRKIFRGKISHVMLRFFQIIALLIAVYGAFCFYQNDIADYMFLRVEFAFLDYEKSAAFILAEYMAMMGTWVVIAYYLSKAVGKLSKSRPSRNDRQRGKE